MQNDEDAEQTGQGTWDEAQKDYLRDCRARNLSLKTVRGKQYHLDQIVRWCMEQTRPVTLQVFARRHFREYLEGRREHGISEKTHRSDVLEIRSFFRFAKAEGWIDSNPLAEYALPKAAKPYVKMPSADELRALLDAITKRWDTKHNPRIKSLCARHRRFYRARDSAIICLLIETGCRVGEVLALRVSDYQSCQIVVRAAKGDEPRVVPVTEAIADYMAAWLAIRPELPLESLFISCYGTEIDPDDFGKSFRRYLAFSSTTLNIPLHGFSLHGLRHYAGSEMAKVDVLLAMRALGHKNLAVTMGYLHLDAQHLRLKHAEAAPLGNLLSPTRQTEPRKKII